MRISCYVVDDEPLAVELMETYVRKTPFLELKGSFGSGAQAYEALQKDPVDLLLCDIQMPGLTGMELSRMLPTQTKVIFTTAFSQYALEGFRVSALDYLLKPVSYADFLKAVRKAEEWFSRSDLPVQAPRSLFLKTEYRLQQVDFDNILFIEGMKDYVKVYLEQGDPVLSLISLKALSERLPEDCFFRAGKSHIVNLLKVKVIERGRVLFGDKSVPISENLRKEFYRRLSLFSSLPVSEE